MKTEIEEKIVARVLYYPESNRLVAHLYNASGCLTYREAVDAHDEAGSFRSMVARLLAALGARIESDPAL